MASNYELRKALYKQIKSKDLTVNIAANEFFRLVKLDGDTFLLNIDIQTNKGNITIKGLTKNNVNSYNTTSDIELSVSDDYIVYVKNTSTTETKITSTSIELVKGILKESYFDPVDTNDGADPIFNSEEDKGAFADVVEGSSSRNNSKVSSFSDNLYVDGDSVLNKTLMVSGLTTVHSIEITNNTNIGDSLEVTGATTLNNTLDVTGNLSVKGDKFKIDASNGNTDIKGTLDVTGNLSIDTNKFNVTADSGDTVIAGTLNVVKAVTLGDTLNVTGLITGELDGNAATATALKTSRTIFGQSFNGTSSVTGNITNVGTITFGAGTNKATLEYTGTADGTFTIPNIGPSAEFVMAQGAQTIAGVKTFSSSPVVPDPTDDTSAVNKQYVDGGISGLQTALNGKQPIDADLTSIAALTGTSGLLRKTAANTWGLDNTSYEITSNKVNIIRPSKTTTNEELATNDKYPSELAIAKRLDYIDDLLDDIDGEGGELGSLNSRVTTLEDGKESLSNKRTDIRITGADNTSYVSELGIKTYVDGRISGVYRPSGDWDAATNTPTLENDDDANTGKVYRVSVAGEQFDLTFAVGDKLAFIEGGAATKWDNVDDVTSVAGKTGNVTLNKGDVGLSNVTNVLQLAASAKGETDDKTLAFGGTFKVLQTLADGTVNERTMTMPTNPNVNNYLTGVSGSANGTATFTRQGLGDLTWTTTHGHTIGQITNLQTELNGKQPLDADLTSIAALAGTSGLLRKTAANTWGLDNTVYENSANKKIAWGTPTDTDYPSSKLVKDSLDSKEPIITAGKTTQYWRGDKTWQTLPTAPSTNLGATHSTTNVTITSSTGNNATINAATDELAGVVTTGPQTFGGYKTFNDNVTVKGDLTVEGDISVNNVNVIETNNGIIFEGGSSSGKVTMELATDPGTTSYSLKVPNKNGTIALIENLPEGKGIKIEESSLVWDSESESLRFVFAE